MKQFTIELDEIIYGWLSHISEATGESIETLIARRLQLSKTTSERLLVGGLYRQIMDLEDGINRALGIRETV